MGAVKSLLAVLAGLLVLLVGVLFTLHNTTPVSIDLVWVRLPEASLSLWLIATFTLGLVVGILLTSLGTLMLRARLGHLGRKQRATEKQLQKLRSEGSNA